MQEAFSSRFIIDGVPRELTPAALLAPVMEKAPEPGPAGGTVIDESIDPAPGLIMPDPARTDAYLDAVCSAERILPVPFAAPCTRGRIAEALIDGIWRNGNVRLDDMPLTVKWFCDPSNVGEMAAFYASVESAAEYMDALGVVLRRCACETGPFGMKVATPFSGAPLIVSAELQPDPHSWLVYVPFDISDYRLGGSLLAQTMGLKGGTAPQVGDADYFIDCFELVREFAEDGVLLSAATIGPGGLGAALRRMCPGDIGTDVDVADVLRSSGAPSASHIVFSEVPGALLQVRDIDFDYLDAECILQDIAYFPLGHPVPGGKLRLAVSDRPGINAILESLMQNAEGED